jgi:predicted nucleotidyltransferase
MAITVPPPWLPTADRLRTAVERLVAAAGPKQIILFGSYARGDADDHSDIDLLVVRRTVDDRFEEMIRLNRGLRGLVMPVDLLVVSEQEFEQRSAMPGTVEHVARCEGRVLYAV